MIREIHIKNLAVIEEANISFGKGLNVITGETGSGKSILMHALEIILGGRPKGELVRSGATELEVSAVLDLSTLHESLRSRLPEIVQDESEVLIKRVIGTKNKVFINGSIATVSLLSEITRGLVTLCSQSEHIELLDSRYHLHVLDSFARHDELLMKYRATYDQYRSVEQKLKSFVQDSESERRKREEAKGLLEELSALDLKEGLKDSLEAEVKRLTNSEKLLEATSEFENALSELSDYSLRISNIGAEIGKLDNPSLGFLDDFNQALVGIESALRGVKRYRLDIDVDQEELESKRSRLSEIVRLERKYKTNDAGLVRLQNEAKELLEAFEDNDDIEGLAKERDKLFDQVLSLASKLSKSRQSAAKQIERELAFELRELNMKEVTFSVQVEKIEPGPSGTDRIEILVSTNPGEAMKPLKGIASGGELSRIMLVLKKLLRDRGGVSVLVFDEVDTGVSGGVARAIGQKLRALAQDSQVLCITHLPQVASLADHHFLVRKDIKKVGKEDRAITGIYELSDQDRVEEIARMLSGFRVTDLARESAKELLSSKDE
jgi:DNA repair protein RecN (Recombination protein N)